MPAPVRVRTAARISPSVELSDLIVSCSPSQDTCGGFGGICSGVNGGGGGGGRTSAGGRTGAATGATACLSERPALFLFGDACPTAAMTKDRIASPHSIIPRLARTVCPIHFGSR